jgi:hypothetical protein
MAADPQDSDGERRSGADRRAYAIGGRRAEEQHGTRAMYQAGCICTPCRAAEANYRSELRRRHLEGKPILGAHVSASLAWRMIRALQVEGFTGAELARRLGLQTPRLQLHTETITRRNLLKVHRVYRLFLLEEPTDGA